MKRHVICSRNLSNSGIPSVIDTCCAVPESATIEGREQLLVTILLRDLAHKFPAVFAEHKAAPPDICKSMTFKIWLPFFKTIRNAQKKMSRSGSNLSISLAGRGRGLYLRSSAYEPVTSMPALEQAVSNQMNWAICFPIPCIWIASLASSHKIIDDKLY